MSGHGSALAEVMEASRSTAAPVQAPPEVGPQQKFSERSKALRDSMQDVCKRGGGKPGDFKTVFDDVETLWSSSQWAGPEVERAFDAVQAKLDGGEDVIAAKLQQQAELVAQRGAFSVRVTGLRHRAEGLVRSNTATWDQFDDAFKALETHFKADEVAGDKAEPAFAEVEKQVAAVEKTVKDSEQYASRLSGLEETVATLKKSRFLPQGGLERTEQAIADAKTLAAGDAPDKHAQALKKLELADKALARAEQQAEAEEEIFNNRDDLLEAFCSRNFQEGKYKGLTPAQVEENLTEEQISELIHLEEDAQRLNNPGKRKVKRREIRDRYAEIMAEVEAAAAADEEDEDEAEEAAPETAEERRARIDKLKRQFKSPSALLQLAADGEIYDTREVFANRGANFAMGVGSVADWVAGYDVMLRNGPDPKGKMTQYRKMVVHFHFSDKEMTKISRAHFKNTHAAADKSHVLIKTADQGKVLNICRGS